MFIYTVAVQASKPSSDSDDSNSDTNQLSESHDDEDAGPMPGVDNPAVAHSPELEAIVPAGRVHGGGNGLEPIGAGHAAGRVSGHGAGCGQRGGRAPEGSPAGCGNRRGCCDGG